LADWIIVFWMYNNVNTGLIIGSEYGNLFEALIDGANAISVKIFESTSPYAFNTAKWSSYVAAFKYSAVPLYTLYIN